MDYAVKPQHKQTNKICSHVDFQDKYGKVLQCPNTIGKYCILKMTIVQIISSAPGQLMQSPVVCRPSVRPGAVCPFVSVSHFQQLLLNR